MERRRQHHGMDLFQNTAQFHGHPELVDEMTKELQVVADD